MLASYFIHLANYNAWANQKLYAVCGALDDQVYLKERPSFFGSIHKTLNHILVADMIWFDRFTSKKTAPATLDKVLFDKFEDLLGARRAIDDDIIDFTISLTDQRIGEILQYTDMAGIPHDAPLSICLGHFFNHQTHHRGQVHGMLSAEMKDPPALDLMYYTLEKLEGAKV